MSNRLICPLRMLALETDRTDAYEHQDHHNDYTAEPYDRDPVACQVESCAWWIEYEGCAIPVLANQAGYIRQILEGSPKR